MDFPPLSKLKMHQVISLRRKAKVALAAVKGEKTDQGSQFTSAAFTGVLLREKIAISTDGRGAWQENMIAERLWRSVKCEEV